jgi:Lipid desaturase domain
MTIGCRQCGSESCQANERASLRLLRTPSYHLHHHLDRKASHCCVLSNLLNPILDGCRFWRGMEFVIERVFGVKKRDDETMLAIVLRNEPDFLTAE